MPIHVQASTLHPGLIEVRGESHLSPAEAAELAGLLYEAIDHVTAGAGVEGGDPGTALRSDMYRGALAYRLGLNLDRPEQAGESTNEQGEAAA